MPKVFVVGGGAKVLVGRGTNVSRIRGVSVSATAPTAGQALIATSAIAAEWQDIASQAELDIHLADVSNPHAVTKAQVGLSLVENTALSTWGGSANIATVGEGAVTSHQAALSIGWGQLTAIPATFAPSAHTHGIADLTDFGADGGYLRSNGAAWTRASGVAWGDLTSVPSTFAPSAHTHPASEVTAGTFAAGAYSFAGSTLASLGTVTTMDLNGGTIDGASVGATTPAAGAFTTLGASGLITVAGGALITGGGPAAAGLIYKSASAGLHISGITGTSYDLALHTPSGTLVLANSTGSTQIRFGGDIYLPSGAVLIGADTNLYRASANVLKTDDAFTAAGLITGSAGVTGGNSLNNAMFTGATSGTPVFTFKDNGTLVVLDTSLIRPGLSLTGTLAVSSTLTVTGTSTLTGAVGVGTAADATQGLRLASSALTGTSQVGAAIQPVVTSAATATGRAIYARLDTAVASFTVANATAVHVANATKGAGSTITTQYGLYVESLTSGATNYAIYTAGSAQSYFGGAVTISGVVTSSSAFYSVGASGGRFQAATSGDTVSRWSVDAGGTMFWSSGAASSDVTLSRGAANRLDLGSGDSLYLSGAGGINIAGTGSLVVAGTGPHAIGQAVTNYDRLLLGGAFVSGGASVDASLLHVVASLTGASGDTAGLYVARFRGTIATQGATQTIGVVAQAYFAEPSITVNAGDTVTAAATVYIAGAPTEGATNAALYIASGDFITLGGIVVGAPTGGAKGAGTINAVAVYDDNVLLTDWVFDLAYDGATTHKMPADGRLWDLHETMTVALGERRLPWMPTRDSFEADRNLGGMVSRLWQGQEQQQLHIAEVASREYRLESALRTLLTLNDTLEGRDMALATLEA